MKNELPEGTPRLHLGWAVGITVAIALPFAFFLGKFNFATWVAFIVWAEYFALGSNPSTARLILPSIPYGAGMGALWCAGVVLVSGLFGGGLVATYLSYTILGFPFMFLLCYWMFKVKAWTNGSLAVFNGLTLFLAVYFTNTIPAIGPIANPYWVVFMSWVWVVAMGFFGWFLGWANIALTFPVRKKANQATDI